LDLDGFPSTGLTASMMTGAATITRPATRSNLPMLIF
jgi:hypothetical protein